MKNEITISLCCLLGAFLFIGMTPDTFETVESPSSYMERINDDGTISAINITQNGDIIITIRGYSYIGEPNTHELVWTRDWQGEAEQ